MTEVFFSDQEKIKKKCLWLIIRLELINYYYISDNYKTQVARIFIMSK